VRACGSSSSPTSTVPGPGACAPHCTLPAPRIPGTGGYRLLDPHRVERLLSELSPDHIEVSDRLTLRGLGRWAARNGVTSSMISHERVDRLLGQFGLPPALARRAADRLNARIAAEFAVVVCATAFAQAEFDRIGAPVQHVPLGVDLDTFTPTRRDPRLRRELAAGADVLLVHCGRLSREKHPQRSIDTTAALHTAGAHVRLVVAGDGPMRRALERRARHLPVTFLGFLGHREDVARLLASADVAVAPGPYETFGLAALEALACGTPVVASRSSALAEIVEPGCGHAVTDDPASFARAVRHLSRGNRRDHRRAARARAEQFDWPSTINRMTEALRSA